MYTNYTYNDYENSQDKKEFIIKLIQDFKASKFYNIANTALEYYKDENTNILNRKMQFVGQNMCLQEDITKANNQIPNGFYGKIVRQANGYLLSNGVNLDENIKSNLGKKLDIKIQRAGLNSQISGVSWAYCFIGNEGFNIDIWDGKEFIPLFDERTGILKAGIRFWQIKANKPIYATLYEQDGFTEISIDNKNTFTITKSKQSYMITRSVDALESSIIMEENWSVLPIVPLYSNDLKRSSLTAGIKNTIDLIDIIASDFGNNLEDSQDVYWVIKNYGGQDLSTFLEDYKYYKSIKVQGDGDASPHTIEVPWQARKEAIQMLKTNLYDVAMALDISTIKQGANATTTAIDAAFYDLDMKTNEFENNVVDFLEGIIELWQEYSKNNEDYTITFTRDRLLNKTEMLEQIYIAREDLSKQKTLELIAPILGIEVTEINTILDQIDAEGVSRIQVPNNISDINNIGEV